MVERNATQTRERILRCCFDEIYHNGYQGMRIDTILDKTGLAKGALYHHFPNKKSLGYAVVDEILMHRVASQLHHFFDNCQDPIAANYLFLTNMANEMTDTQVALGCPINNLSQEMAGLDDGFKERLCAIYTLWSEILTTAFEQGKVNGVVRDDIDCETTAMFILSSLQGIIGSAKCMQSKPALVSMMRILCEYILSLKQA